MASDKDKDKKKRVIKPGPIEGMPVTQAPKQTKRPGLGSGAAEGAAQDVEKTKSRRQRKIKSIFGN